MLIIDQRIDKFHQIKIFGFNPMERHPESAVAVVQGEAMCITIHKVKVLFFMYEFLEEIFKAMGQSG